MKKRIASLTAVLLSACFLIGSSVSALPPVSAQDNQEAEPTPREIVLNEPKTSTGAAVEMDLSDPYVYPVDTDSEEWGRMDQIERAEACQIPEEELRALSTDLVIQAVFDHPLFWQIFAYNTFELAYHRLSEQFNIIQELEAREDAAARLLARYQSRYQEDPETYNEELNYLEILLAQEVYIQKLTEEEAILLDELVADRAAYRENRGNKMTFFYSSLSEERAEPYYFPDYKYHYNERKVKTPAGSTVIAKEWIEPLFNDDYRDAMQEFEDAVAKAHGEVIQNPTNRYNCHSYAWYRQSTSNTYWIENASAYMNDGSYTKSSVPTVGAKIYYAGADHSGVVFSLSNNQIIVSKWGYLGLVRHVVNQCPYPDAYRYEYYR